MAALAAAVSLPTMAAAQDWNRALGALTGRDAEQQQDRRDSQDMRSAQDEIDRIRNERAEIRSERRDIARQRGVRFVDDDTSQRRRDRMAGSSGSSSAQAWNRELEDERAGLARDRRHLDDERSKLENERGRTNKDTLGGTIDDLLGDRKR
jgi:hypothetical protein